MEFTVHGMPIAFNDNPCGVYHPRRLAGHYRYSDLSVASYIEMLNALPAGEAISTAIAIREIAEDQTKQIQLPQSKRTGHLMRTNGQLSLAEVVNRIENTNALAEAVLSALKGK